MADDDLAVKDDYLVLSEDVAQIREVIDLNLGSDGLDPSDLEVLKMPTGGGEHWTIETLDGSPETTDEIHGILIHQQTVRTYWEDEFSGGGEPPDCYSPDGMMGHSPTLWEGGTRECATCPFDEWGTAENGDGKACKEKKNLYFFMNDEFFPKLLRVPPTSLNPVKKYLIKLASRRIPFYAVETKLELEQDSNDSFEYSVLKPSVSRQLDEDEQEEIKERMELFKPALEESPVIMAEDEDTE